MLLSIRPMTQEDTAAVAVVWKDGLQQTIDASPWWIRPIIAPKIRQMGEQAMQEKGDVGPQGKHLMKHWNDGPPNERRMFVAVLTSQQDDDGKGHREEQQDIDEGRIVGVIGVKKGFSFLDDKKQNKNATSMESNHNKEEIETDTQKTDETIIIKDQQSTITEEQSSESNENDHDEKEDNQYNLASIWRMSVDSNYRRQGIGLKLLQQAEQWGRDNGCTRMKLITGNPIAARFYIMAGGYHPVSPTSTTSSKSKTVSWKEWMSGKVNRAIFSLLVGYYEKDI